jgi:hypothetical protein
MELHLPNRDEIYRAEVQWRTGNEVGVAFPAGMAASSIVPEQAPGDLAGRVRRLESEMSVLQRKVKELQSELRKYQGAE